MKTLFGSALVHMEEEKRDLVQSKGLNGEILKQFSLTWVRITIAVIITSMPILLKTIQYDNTRQKAYQSGISSISTY